MYGGGGIEPDHYVLGPVEGFDPTRFGRLLYARQVFEKYAERYSAQGDTRLGAQGTNRKIVAPDFVVTDAMLADFRTFLQGEGVTIDEASFTKDLPFIKAMIRFQIDQALFGVDEARQRLLAQDPQAQVALGLFGQAEQLSQAALAGAGQPGRPRAVGRVPGTSTQRVVDWP